jgi:hypothetical protein
MRYHNVPTLDDTDAVLEAMQTYGRKYIRKTQRKLKRMERVYKIAHRLPFWLVKLLTRI